MGDMMVLRKDMEGDSGLGGKMVLGGGGDMVV